MLHVVGVGPGDPELVTIKARNILLSADIIIAPKTSDAGQSLALTVVRNLIGDKEVCEFVFPMSHDKQVLNQSWDRAALLISDLLTQQKDVALITLGDPTVYSTGMYIYKRILDKGFEADLISGVPSFCAAAAAAGISLAENKETLAVIPSAYEIDLLPLLDNFDNIVLMKPVKNVAVLKEMSENFNTVATVSKCGMEDQRITRGLPQDTIEYFTTIILKKDKGD